MTNKEHNKIALEQQYGEFKKDRKIASEGYYSFGHEDKVLYEFAKTKSGDYIQKQTQRLPSGKDVVTYKGEISYQNEDGELENYFVTDVKMYLGEEQSAFSGFAYNLKTEEPQSFLTVEKPQLFDEVEKFFESAKLQAIVEQDSTLNAASSSAPEVVQ